MSADCAQILIWVSVSGPKAQTTKSQSNLLDYANGGFCQDMLNIAGYCLWIDTSHAFVWTS